MVLQRSASIPGPVPTVKFKASDHGDIVLAGLKKLRERQQLFDVVLLAENERLPAHRVVLASCSDYFRAMFTDGLMECQLDEIELNGVTAKGIKSLLDFAYSSKILIDADNVEDVLAAAHHIQILPVLEACVNYMKSHISFDNCVAMVTLAELFSLEELKLFCYKFMSEHFLTFCMSLEFHNLSLKQMLTLLELEFPVDCSECDVLSAVMGWICHHHGDTESHVLPLLLLIKFENIDVEELDKMPNVAEFYSLLTTLSVNPQMKQFMNKITKCQSNRVQGLQNVRGFQEALIISGGFLPGLGMSNDIKVYTNTKNPPKYLTKVPHVEQCNFGMNTLNNQLYVVGGCYNNEQMEEIVHSYGFRYCPRSKSWEHIRPMNHERCRFYLAAAAGKLYAIGGDPSASTETGDAAICERYDPADNSWQMISSLPGNRMQHAGTVLDHSIYVSGGLQDPDGQTFRDFHVYDTQTDIWRSLPPMPTPRADHTMFTYGNKVCCIGGWYEDVNTQQRIMVPDIDCFNIETRQWETIGEVATRRLYATYTVIGSELYVVGGWLDGDHQKKCTTVQRYNLETRQWSQDAGEIGEVWEHASCSLYVPRCDLQCM